ncbi:MAG: hypothetical protein JKX85_14180 [Phycisphaeraceae bacterium]|nr:hypothetical protein [Phycisphaeraceae bacterium]
MARRIAKRSPDSDKTRFELRFDTDLYREIQKIADEAQISVNQLMQGISRWAVKTAHVGEGKLEGEGTSQDITTTPQPGCVWFGRESDVAEYTDSKGEQNFYQTPPEIFFNLDFTERHVVRENFPSRIKKG